MRFMCRSSHRYITRRRSLLYPKTSSLGVRTHHPRSCDISLFIFIYLFYTLYLVSFQLLSPTLSKRSFCFLTLTGLSCDWRMPSVCCTYVVRTSLKRAENHFSATVRPNDTIQGMQSSHRLMWEYSVVVVVVLPICRQFEYFGGQAGNDPLFLGTSGRTNGILYPTFWTIPRRDSQASELGSDTLMYFSFSPFA